MSDFQPCYMEDWAEDQMAARNNALVTWSTMAIWLMACTAVLTFLPDTVRTMPFLAACVCGGVLGFCAIIESLNRLGYLDGKHKSGEAFFSALLWTAPPLMTAIFHPLFMSRLSINPIAVLYPFLLGTALLFRLLCGDQKLLNLTLPGQVMASTAIAILGMLWYIA